MVALVLALVIKTFVVQAFYIPSESMENTLLVDDRVLVNKLVYHTRDIERGDVVVFYGVDSWDPEVQVEEPANPVSGCCRWVGTRVRRGARREGLHQAGHRRPRRHVKCCDAQGRVTVNGVPLDERSYLVPAANAPSDSDVRGHRAAGPPVGDGRPPLGLLRLPLPPGRPRRRHDPRWTR